MHWTQEETPPGRDEFIEANAVVLVGERDEKISRMKAVITKLEKTRRANKRHITRLQRIIAGLAARIAAQAELLSKSAECRED